MTGPAAPAARDIEGLGALTPGDLEGLNRLVAQSGWNQTSRDWELFFRLGSIHVIRDADGALLASGAVLPYGDASIAWISMILVTPAARGQGLGMRIFRHCLEVAQELALAPVLDATPAGERLYRQFGFQPRFSLSRWQRAAAGAGQAARPAVRPGAAAIAAIAAIDAAAFGERRHALIQDFLLRDDTRHASTDNGIALSRGGRIARQIGPIVAPDQTSAIALLDPLLTGESGPVYIDIRQDREQLRDWLIAAGFTSQRTFLRMSPDSPNGNGNAALMHAIAGPEFG
jgi:GNAT superfamily N-acetyltransferase